MKVLQVMALLFIITIVANATLNTKEGLKTYPVTKVAGAPALSGKGDDPLWKRARLLTDFSYPWEKGKPRPTRFRALHNEEWVFFLFDIDDPSVFLLSRSNHKSEVAASSRAEIFFKVDDHLNPYYCLEIDPLGRVLDYEGTFHRNFNLEWYWPRNQLVIKTHQHSGGYSVEFAISKSSLNDLSLMRNNTIQAGLFRADCFKDKGGDMSFRWISWVKPDAATPDFHIPSSFGQLRLED